MILFSPAASCTLKRLCEHAGQIGIALHSRKMLDRICIAQYWPILSNTLLGHHLKTNATKRKRVTWGQDTKLSSRFGVKYTVPEIPTLSVKKSMYLIEINKLQAGDIFLTTQKHIVSKAIKAFTTSDYSHAMLHVGDGSYIHSDGDGVHAGNVQRLLFDDEKYIQVLRLREDIDRKLINAACAFARNEVGKQYSVKDAINTKNPLSKKADTNRQFCSRLVAQSFESVGLNLVENSSYCTPQELDDSELTNQVSDCIRKATDAEIEFANSENPLEKQTNITNSIFTKVRDVTGQDIQTFEQLSNYLLENNEYDSKITNIIKDSGYLFMWQHEMNANPWRYSHELFMSLPVSKEKLNQIAAIELNSAINTKQRYALMYDQFMRIWHAKRLQYAVIHIMLYQKLIELTDLRVSIISHVIENT
jgi:uncharacterized protein YycO